MNRYLFSSSSSFNDGKVFGCPGSTLTAIKLRRLPCHALTKFRAKLLRRTDPAGMWISRSLGQ